MNMEESVVRLCNFDISTNDSVFFEIERAWNEYLHSGQDLDICVDVSSVSQKMGKMSLPRAAIIHPPLLDQLLSIKSLDNQNLKSKIIETWRNAITQRSDHQPANHWLVEISQVLLKHEIPLYQDQSSEKISEHFLSFIHNVLWAGYHKDDACADAIQKLIDAGVPVCDDFLNDAPYVKHKLPKTFAVSEHQKILRQMPEKAPSLKKKI